MVAPKRCASCRVPTVLRDGRFRFAFYSADDNEPRHVHVFAEDKEAKIWLDRIDLAWNSGFTWRELGVILHVVRENREQLIRAWNAFFET